MNDSIKMPNSIEIEKSVLGTIINYPELMTDCLQFLTEKSFYNEMNRIIFNTLNKMYNQNKGIDLVNLTREIILFDSNFKDFFYLTSLTSSILRHGFDYNCQILADLTIRRDLITSSYENFKNAQNETIDLIEIIDSLEKSLMMALSPIKNNSVKHIKNIVDEYLIQINSIQNNENGLIGLPSGYTSLDRIIGGFKSPDFIIIAARPSMGKTAFIINICKNMLLFDKNIALFSLEMSNLQIMNRLMIDLTDISHLSKEPLTKEESDKLYDYISEICVKNFYIDDSGGLSISELKRKARLLKIKSKIDIIIIDYIQLMNDKSGKNGSRELEISSISRQLKELAKELNIPIIALSQLNRQLESRTDKRPNLGDLRESGSLEQDTDIVMFIHRPEKYGINEDSEGNSTKGLAEIIIAKNRNGAITDINLHFNSEKMRFSEYSNIDLMPF